jgi:hypothetical protein
VLAAEYISTGSSKELQRGSPDLSSHFKYRILLTKYLCQALQQRLHTSSSHAHWLLLLVELLQQ